MLFGEEFTGKVKQWLEEQQNASLFWEDMSPAETIEVLIIELERDQPEIGFRGPAFDEPI